MPSQSSPPLSETQSGDDSAVSSGRFYLLSKKFETGTPWVFAASALSVLLFVAIAGVVMYGTTRELDERILLGLRDPNNRSDPIGPEWLEGYMRDITALGGFGVLSLLVLSVSGFLYATGRQRTAFRIFAISLSGWLLSQGMKFTFQRPRPDLVPYGADVFSSSFPSGHAMVSAVVFLTLGAALARTTNVARVRAYVMTLAIVLTLAVGFSRVYLGVHWPTDVLGGWVLGGAWSGLAWIVLRRIERERGERLN
ncbi:MAG: hypothetical protein CTY31_12875 [Hyphomicrobium sp.]|nr:MAG: hypothetical protein CTY31_12875 [Hyphomicrobium sp.]